MQPHTRALIAASMFALITGKKVAGLYDHAAAHDLRIAAEARGNQVQAFDGERNAKFGGTLPELYDATDKAFVSLTIEGTKAQGYDRATSGFYTAEVTNDVVQIFDHAANTWFSYDIQNADAPSSYLRGDNASG
jgi:hypothetical protein